MPKILSWKWRWKPPYLFINPFHILIHCARRKHGLELRYIETPVSIFRNHIKSDRCSAHHFTQAIFNRDLQLWERGLEVLKLNSCWYKNLLRICKACYNSIKKKNMKLQLLFHLENYRILLLQMKWNWTSATMCVYTHWVFISETKV